MKYQTRLQKWSYRIRIRDGNTCYLCERKFKKTEAHHIYPKKIYRQKALKLDTGITLCESCHKLVHISGKSWRKFTPIFNLYMKRKEIRKFNNNVRYSTYKKYRKRAKTRVKRRKTSRKKNG